MRATSIRAFCPTKHLHFVGSYKKETSPPIALLPPNRAEHAGAYSPQIPLAVSLIRSDESDDRNPVRRNE
jgi:hypothetical protein